MVLAIAYTKHVFSSSSLCSDFEHLNIELKKNKIFGLSDNFVLFDSMKLFLFYLSKQ